MFSHVGDDKTSSLQVKSSSFYVWYGDWHVHVFEFLVKDEEMKVVKRKLDVL
jgi:hypothetical protein